jgi:hypothetical protein
MIAQGDKTILRNSAFDRMVQAAKGQLARQESGPKPRYDTPADAQLAVAHH